MRNSSFYDTLSDLNDDLYGNVSDYKGFKLLDTYNDNTGLLIALYDIGNEETLFAIKGTDISSIKDGKADLAMGIHKQLPAQFHHAETYYQQIQKDYKTIIFTGYSLGASIAQMLGAKYGNETICFEPYGVGDIIHGSTNNIINFGNVYDIVFMMNLTAQLGKIYLIPVQHYVTHSNIGTHIPQHHGKPSQATEYTGDLQVLKDKYFIGRSLMISKTQELTDKAQQYIKSGLIPNVQQKIDAYAKQLRTK